MAPRSCAASTATTRMSTSAWRMTCPASVGEGRGLGDSDGDKDHDNGSGNDSKDDSTHNSSDSTGILM